MPVPVCLPPIRCIRIRGRACRAMTVRRGHSGTPRPRLRNGWPSTVGAVMVELEEVDLAKALAMLSKQLARTAADIVLELDNPERTHEMADALEETARLLREHALAIPPKVIDSELATG